MSPHHTLPCTTDGCELQASVKQLIDSPLPKLVTLDVLLSARQKEDLKVSNYQAFSVDFENHLLCDPVDKMTEFQQRSKICSSALDLVGRTPMVRLSRLAKKYGLKCDLVAKCEFLSIGGSVKDRIGLQMIEEAEQSGRLQTGDILVEATSGNTGIGLCLAAAVKGYRCLITLPEKMSQEKLNTMAALGGEIIRTATGAAWDSLDSHIGLAVQLEQTLPRCHFLDQYSNSANPRAHYLGTAEEILFQCDDKIDVLVMTVGTGGTVTGISKKVKERIPSCKIVGVDPRGSILSQPDSLNDEKRGQSYLVEGIGYDFIPSTLHRNLVDEWVKTDDEESFRFARELIRLEGLLVGGSSGAAIAGALQVARHLGPDDRCVVLLPDSARNYMTKFIADDWMVDNGFYPPQRSDCCVYGSRQISDLSLQVPLTLTNSATVREAIDIMAAHHTQVVVMVNKATPSGLVTQRSISSALLSGKCTLQDSVDLVKVAKFRKAQPDTPLVDVSRMLEMHSHVVITDAQDELVGIVTDLDILKAASDA